VRHRILVVVCLSMTLTACTSFVVQGAVPRCSAGDEVSDELILEAQSVPSAQLLPCLAELPPDWMVTEFQVRDGETSIGLSAHEGAGGVARAPPTKNRKKPNDTEEFSGKENTRLFVTLSRVGEDSLVGTDFYTFAGGCVTYSFELRGEGKGALHAEARSALGFTPRSSVEASIESETDFEL
jgi:hypothetical protein